MKKFLLLLLLASCTKEQVDRITDDPGSIEYTVDGDKTTFTSAAMFKYIGTETLYDLRGQTGINSAIRLVMITDSLKTQTYLTQMTPPAILVVNGKQFTTYHPDWPGQITVRVDNYQQGKVDGIFSGKFFSLNVDEPIPQDSIVLTGRFTNVQIIF